MNSHDRIDETVRVEELIRQQARREASKLVLSALEQMRTILNQVAKDCHEIYDDACEHLEKTETHQQPRHRNGVRS